MRVIVAGSRSVARYDIVANAIRTSKFQPTVILSGTARGVDRLGERYGVENSIPVERYPANWEEHGKVAGIKRNCVMAKNADALIAIWDEESRGTKHMIDEAKRIGLPVDVRIVRLGPAVSAPT